MEEEEGVRSVGPTTPLSADDDGADDEAADEDEESDEAARESRASDMAVDERLRADRLRGCGHTEQSGCGEKDVAPPRLSSF